jgi:sulfur-oxidizing protein SoxY
MPSMPQTPTLTRRKVLTAGAGLATILVLRPAQAAPGVMDAAIRAAVGEAPLRPGKVKLDIPPLVENGNSVTVTVTVDSPMTAADHVRRIVLFNEKNPQPNVADFRLGPRAGRANVSTRMRLATSQKVVAVAELNDGSIWSDSADVIVTLAACIEE